ncbi:MAG TPA: hypothetical protein VGX25_34810 [Actinophytocola sp.]|uniref:hypothetical protein n=1 Tax=Actinophytocola sp. TaxID=1872138 RepID=UPI002DDD8A85|nr:hypothetical protein [Actinophytocola sp.]HEV2784583.1 hypothetical protein [Actinophytocola sp.]
MRRFITAGLAAIAFGVVLVAGAGAAQADDNGKNDGPQCSYTEICFRQTAGSDAMVKQFWYSANHARVEGVHDYYRWYETATGSRGPYILDSARQLRNRDSSCTVYVWDMDGSGNWLKLWHQPANSGSWMAIPPQNNGHSRCGEGAPVNK